MILYDNYIIMTKLTAEAVIAAEAADASVSFSEKNESNDKDYKDDNRNDRILSCMKQ
jgi:hypothetical protein